MPYTTLNVQHIESLNDAVSQILHTEIKETILIKCELRMQIELIDLPPEDLIKRTYMMEKFIFQNKLRLQSIFPKGNLSALRVSTACDR